jgi:hypothetical protein
MILGWILIALPFALLGLALIGAAGVSPWVWIAGAAASGFILFTYAMCAVSARMDDIENTR